jgi:hypothetical protein
MFLLALGFILQMNKFAPGPWVMAAGAGVIGFVLYRWFGAVIAETSAATTPAGRTNPSARAWCGSSARR